MTDALRGVSRAHVRSPHPPRARGSRSLDEQSDPPAVARDAPVKLAAAISIANDSPLSGCAIACTPFMQKPLGIDSLSLHVFVPPQPCAVTRNLDVEYPFDRLPYGKSWRCRTSDAPGQESETPCLLFIGPCRPTQGSDPGVAIGCVARAVAARAVRHVGRQPCCTVEPGGLETLSRCASLLGSARV